MKKSDFNNPQVIAYSIASLSFIVIAIAGGFVLNNALSRNDYTKISVNGSASEVVQSDNAIWKIRFKKESNDIEESLKQVKEDEVIVRELLSIYPFEEDEVGSTSYNTYEVFKRDENNYETTEIDRYVTEATIKVSTKDVWLVDSAYSELSNLIFEDIDLLDSRPEYYYSDLDSLKITLLDEATANAKKRAQTIADGDDLEVENAIQVSQGVFQVNAAGDKSVSDYGYFDTRSISKEVNAVVSASFRAN